MNAIDMEKRIILKTLIAFVSAICSLYSCSYPDVKNSFSGISVDFGNPQLVKSSDIIAAYDYVKLENTETSLIGEIDQIERYRDRIYVLDTYRTGALFVFSKEGNLLFKLEKKGNGPGEFILPHSFKIDPQGYLYILDRALNRLLKYVLDDLTFVEEISLPAPSPLSFSIIPDKKMFVYYYPARQESSIGKKQLVIADKAGKVINTFYDATPSGKVLHGDPNNIYTYGDELRVYPYFDNKVYRMSLDSLVDCYQFQWGKYAMPDESLFNKYEDSGDIMKELSVGEKDWIRLMYVYEIEQMLWVKYYIKNDFYLSGWNKKTGDTFNIKSTDIKDDLGMGGHFPLPVGISGQRMIGVIYPYEIDIDKVTDAKLKQLLGDVTDESNPILVFYNLK